MGSDSLDRSSVCIHWKLGTLEYGVSSVTRSSPMIIYHDVPGHGAILSVHVLHVAQHLSVQM
jgi:hypothetical protein